ncbi:hypothetical protein L1987_08208 [Smallanthus sonchifolius]|uniref:Uncharacterized protein n=1 Tax=Smallanthus sonchifolius TaxID=185202 RepID=A0ACB9JLN3_9ASTR|nr:hypothetical protein L1987_08208 [Smallanthus sonchifolius]
MAGPSYHYKARTIYPYKARLFQHVGYRIDTCLLRNGYEAIRHGRKCLNDPNLWKESDFSLSPILGFLIDIISIVKTHIYEHKCRHANI